MLAEKSNPLIRSIHEELVGAFVLFEQATLMEAEYCEMLRPETHRGECCYSSREIISSNAIVNLLRRNTVVELSWS